MPGSRFVLCTNMSYVYAVFVWERLKDAEIAFPR